MKKILIGAGLAIILLLFAGIYKFNYLANQSGQMIDDGGIGAMVQKKHKIIKSISPQKFQNLAKTEKYTIIDVRTPDEFLNQPLFTDALNIDYYKPDFRENLAKLDSDKSYLIYCRSGSRSGKTLKIMEELGFKNIADLAGGRNNWLKIFK